MVIGQLCVESAIKCGQPKYFAESVIVGTVDLNYVFLPFLFIIGLLMYINMIEVYIYYKGRWLH